MLEDIETDIGQVSRMGSMHAVRLLSRSTVLFPNQPTTKAMQTAMTQDLTQRLIAAVIDDASLSEIWTGSFLLRGVSLTLPGINARGFFLHPGGLPLSFQVR
jgi:hypothetical protein